MKYLLGVDVGTHETKGILIDLNYRPVAEHAVGHHISNPRPQFYEMDAEGVWWREFCEIVPALMKKAGIEAKDIVGVGVSVMGCDCIPVDEDCHPLRPAILYGIDARASEQIQRLIDTYGEKGVFDMFGHIPRSDDIAPKILWIRDNEPKVYEHTYKFLTGSSYMAAKLTGQYKIDRFLAAASFQPIYDETGNYHQTYGPLFARADQMAEAADVTDLAGHVTRNAAIESGLAEGTPVIVGTGDSTAESIAAGLMTPGTLFVQFGSTLFYIFCVNRELKANTQDHFPGSSLFTIPGKYAVGGGTNCAGALTEWVRNHFYQPELNEEPCGGQNAYSIMAKEASDITPGSDGLIILPYLFGERSPINDPLARGVMFGLTGKHTRAHFARAALEASAYSLGSHIRLFRKHHLDPTEVIIAGGGTKNLVWMQITADVIGLPVRLASDWQTACYGDACMAAIGAGLLSDFAELKTVMPESRLVMPQVENTQFYQKYQDIYEALYQNTAELMHQLP